MPLVAWVPVQPPEAVQDVASVEDQVRVDAVPEAMLVGLALSVTVGAIGVDAISMVTLERASPPAPEQVSVKVLVELKAAVPSLPDSGMLPDHAPDATQAVASVEDHERVALVPDATEPADEVNDTVGAAAGLSEATVETSPPHAFNNIRVATAARAARAFLLRTFRHAEALRTYAAAQICWSLAVIARDGLRRICPLLL